MDLRALLLAAVAWVGALAGVLLGDGTAPAVVLRALCVALSLLVLVAVAVGRSHRGGRPRTPVGTGVGIVVVLVGVTLLSSVRAAGTASSVPARWAPDRPVGDLVVVVGSDPAVRHGRFADGVVLDATLTSLLVRGQGWHGREPVRVLAPDTAAWRSVRYGATLRLLGRLGPGGRGLAATVTAQGPPTQVRAPAHLLGAAAAARSAVRAASVGPEPGARLVPALVTGDDQDLPAEVTDEFRTAGLTHLTAVSGTNLTLVLGFLLVIARAAGVTGRGRVVVGALGVVGFVLLARPEPSVVRAAAMGTVALLGLGSGGRTAGTRALGVGVLVLLVLDPWLATSVGFALSALATAGILLVAPAFRDGLGSWLPRPVAEAVAVPLAAQLACTPLVAAISGQVSLVAVAANLVVAPLVGPATVLGLVGGLLGLVWAPLGAPFGWAAGACAQVVVVVAGVAAGLPGASVGWAAGSWALASLTALSLVLLLVGGALLRRRRVVVGVGGVLLLALLQPAGGLAGRVLHPGWPPPGWVLVMCDVGQGDALVLGLGHGRAVVVDAGPDPDAVDGCLRRLGVRVVPLVLLTHFHADHVDGLPGVLRGRAVGEVEVSPLRAPSYGADQVDAWARGRGLPVQVASYGEERSVGAVSWRVVAPRRVLSDSPNDASVAWLVTSHGIRLLLTGDVEPPSQGALRREPGLAPVDVLKVPHHGSRYQDPGLLTGLRARVALVSVGADNDYGHPDPAVLALLRASGALVRRTDRDGDVAVVVRDGDLRVVSRGGR